MHLHQTARQYVRLIMTFTAGLLLIALPALAQTDSGNVVGKVLDKSGAPLPGATVTLTGIGAPQTFVTNADGDYRFLRLSPGKYSVSAELEGMGKSTRNVEVTVANNAEINLSLSPTVAEAITVTAATPIIDRRDAGTGQNLQLTELENVPTARDPWVVLQSVPGVLVDRVNVGGNKSGQQSYFVGKGVERHQTAWNLDGVNVADMQTTGSSAFYYDFDSFQELNVQTSSADPSVQTPGVQISMVTKRGTNELVGSGRWLVTDKGFQTSPSVPSEAASYDPPLTVVNSIKHIDDAGIEVGGPLMRDKLWLWGAYSKNSINNVVSNTSTQYQKTVLDNGNLKLNTQLLPSNSGSIYWMYSNKLEQHRSVGPTRPVETSVNQTGPGYILKLDDTQQLSPSAYLTAKLSHLKNGYTLTPVGGRDKSVYWDIDGVPHDSYKFFTQDVPQDSAQLDGSNFFKTGSVDNELKYGFGYRNTPVESLTAWPGDGTWGDFSLDYAGITRDAIPKYGSNYFNGYVGDTLLLGSWTLTGGLRYDRQSAKNKASSVPANPAFPDILPAVNFAGDSRALVWKGVSPRLGVTWSPGQDNKTLLRASYSRYMNQLGSSDVGPSNPFYRVQILYYYWSDLNKDNHVQRNEIDFDSGIADWSNIDPNHPGSGFSTGRVDYNMKPPRTDEFTIGAQREIMPAFAVSAGYTYRKLTNFVWDAWEKHQGAGDLYTPADFEPVTSGGVPTLLTGTLPNGQSYSTGYYRLKSGVPAPIYTVSTNRPDYYQTYSGVELSATKRMQDHWMLRANVTLMDWKQHVGANGFQDPTTLIPTGFDSCNRCNGSVVASSGGEDGYINSHWAFSVQGEYELPRGFTFGTAFVGRQGFVIPYYRRVNARDGFGNKRVLVNGFGNDRLDNLYNLDLRIAKQFSLFSGVGLTVSADLFNATNAGTVLWRDNRLYTATGPDVSSGNNNIQEQQSPRVWRLGARFTF